MTAAEQIQQIAAAVGVTAEIIQMDENPLEARRDAIMAAYEADLGEAPFETRREMGV